MNNILNTPAQQINTFFSTATIARSVTTRNIVYTENPSPNAIAIAKYLNKPNQTKYSFLNQIGWYTEKGDKGYCYVSIVNMGKESVYWGGTKTIGNTQSKKIIKELFELGLLVRSRSHRRATYNTCLSTLGWEVYSIFKAHRSLLKPLGKSDPRKLKSDPPTPDIDPQKVTLPKVLNLDQDNKQEKELSVSFLTAEEKRNDIVFQRLKAEYGDELFALGIAATQKKLQKGPTDKDPIAYLTGALKIMKANPPVMPQAAPRTPSISTPPAEPLDHPLRLDAIDRLAKNGIYKPLKKDNPGFMCFSKAMCNYEAQISSKIKEIESFTYN